MKRSALVLLPLAAFVSVTFTRAFLRQARIRAWLDVPNQRSSHTRPTPRGGGLAIVATFIVFVAYGAVAGFVTRPLAIAFVGGVALVAAVGFVDDIRGVPSWVRIAIHVIAAAWAVAWIGAPQLMFVGHTVQAFASPVLSVIVITWCINLYNFMDGIDSLAAAEAVFVASAGGLLFHALGSHGPAWIAFVTAAAALGFLGWNWPPAKVFMGDVGSGSLGFIFGTLAIAVENSGTMSLLAVLLLMGVFVGDATLTLLRRMVRGERWYEAHRSHAYQRLVQLGWSHGRVTRWVIVVNLALALLVWWGAARDSMLRSSVIGGLLIAGLYVAVGRANSRTVLSASTQD